MRGLDCPVAAPQEVQAFTLGERPEDGAELPTLWIMRTARLEKGNVHTGEDVFGGHAVPIFAAQLPAEHADQADVFGIHPTEAPLLFSGERLGEMMLNALFLRFSRSAEE